MFLRRMRAAARKRQLIQVFQTSALLTFSTRQFSVMGIILSTVGCFTASIATIHYVPEAPQLSSPSRMSPDTGQCWEMWLGAMGGESKIASDLIQRSKIIWGAFVAWFHPRHIKSDLLIQGIAQALFLLFFFKQFPM